MQDFLQWVESKHNIRVVSYDNSGSITFSVNDNRYTYMMDAAYFYNGFFPNWMKYKPGKALNFAKQKGTLIDPKPQPKPKPKMVQGRLF